MRLDGQLPLALPRWGPARKKLISAMKALQKHCKELINRGQVCSAYAAGLRQGARKICAFHGYTSVPLRISGVSVSDLFDRLFRARDNDRGPSAVKGRAMPTPALIHRRAACRLRLTHDIGVDTCSKNKRPSHRSPAPHDGAPNHRARRCSERYETCTRS
jgi:hypothetical protein